MCHSLWVKRCLARPRSVRESGVMFRFFRWIESVAIECAGKIEKFPEPGEKSSLWTFVDPHLGAAVEDDNGVRLDLARLFCFFDRQEPGKLLLFCFTERCQRTGCTARCAIRAADHGAEVHQRLVEITRAVRRNEGCSQLFQRLCSRRDVDRSVVSGDAAEDAQYIAIYSGDAFAKCDGGDGACGVRADAREREQIAVAFWQESVVFSEQDLRRFTKMVGTGIIAEPFPELVEPVFTDVCEICNLRQFCDKTCVVRDDGLHLCLLEHDLREPNVIRRRIFAPGQQAAIFVVPAEHPVCERRSRQRKCAHANASRE